MSEKKSYHDELKAQMDVWREEINILKAEADHAHNQNIKAEFNGAIEEIHAKQQVAEAKLQELHEAEEHAWEHLKEDIEIAWDHLKDALKLAGKMLMASDRKS